MIITTQTYPCNNDYFDKATHTEFIYKYTGNDNNVLDIPEGIPSTL